MPHPAGKGEMFSIYHALHGSITARGGIQNGHFKILQAWKQTDSTLIFAWQQDWPLGSPVYTSREG